MLNLAIFGVVAGQLTNTGGYVCIMWEDTSNSGLCNLSYIVAGISIAFLGIISFFQYKYYLYSPAIQSIFLCLLACLYLLAGSLTTLGSVFSADVLGIEGQYWRTVVYGLFWTQFSTCFIMVGSTAFFANTDMGHLPY